MTAIFALFSTLPILLAGDFWRQLFTASQPISFGQRWSLALALGAGFVTLLHFDLSLLVHSQALTLTIIITMLISIIQLWRQRFVLQSWRQHLPFKNFIYKNWLIGGLAIIFFCVVFAVSSQAGLGHDGYAFWGYNAKVIFYEGGRPLPIGRFANIPHLDYPLLVPTMEAWIYRFLGGVDETAVKIIFVLFYAALTLLFYDAVRQKYGSILSLFFTALMALTPQLAAVSALSGYADVPLMLYVWEMAVLCQNWLNKGNQHNLFLGGILAAIAFWVKREGAVYFVVNTVLIILAVGWFSTPAKGKKLTAISLYLLPGLLIITPWLLYLRWWQIPNSDFSAFTMNNIEQYVSRLPIILMLLSKQLFLAIERWGLLWWIFVISLAFKGLHQEARWHILLLIILPVASLSFAFILSSWQPFTTHINISLERLILHTVPLAWYLIVLQATGLNQWLSNLIKQT